MPAAARFRGIADRASSTRQSPDTLDRIGRNRTERRLAKRALVGWPSRDPKNAHEASFAAVSCCVSRMHRRSRISPVRAECRDDPKTAASATGSRAGARFSGSDPKFGSDPGCEGSRSEMAFGLGLRSKETSESAARSPSGFDRRSRFAIRLAPLDRLALVVLLLAFREADGHLHAAVLEVHADRHQRHPLLDGPANELPDFVAVQQQLAAAQRLVLGVAAMAVRADVHVVDEHFAVLDAGEAVAQVHAALADRLHLGPEQNQPGLERLEEMVVVRRLAVLGDVRLGFFAIGGWLHQEWFRVRGSFGTLRAQPSSMIARRYQDLVCWQLANELKRRVYAFTATMPAKRDFEYCDRIRRSARGAPRTIAEGFGRFRPADLARYLEFARASLAEAHNHLCDGRDQGYLSAALCQELGTLADRALGATTNLWKYLDGCKSKPNVQRRTLNPEPRTSFVPASPLATRQESCSPGPRSPCPRCRTPSRDRPRSG